MICSACQTELPAGSRFCNLCGAEVGTQCSECGNTVPSLSLYCNYCGQDLASLKAPIASDAVKNKRRRASDHIKVQEPERRHLTVMFCDLVDSTKLAQALDPEELRDLVRRYQDLCAAVIDRYRGHIAQYLGDGLLMYFGYPQAHDDDTERALRAGLDIIRELEASNAARESERGIRLAVRIGIHTGHVVVGEMGGGEKRETLALGDAISLAARLQALAPPDSILISAATWRLTQGFFLTEKFGDHRVKGFKEPVSTYRVIQATGVRSRLDVAAASGLTPLVGREQEIALLMDRWKQGEEEVGQFLLLSGEAGIGKSRLIQIFREHLKEVPHTWLECRCSSYTQDSPLYPVIELLQRALDFHTDDNAEQKLLKLENAVSRVGLNATETIPLIASLLSLPLGEHHSLASGTPDRQRRKTMEILLQWLFGMSKLQPLVMVAEDFHWADPSSVELLGVLGQQAPATGMVVLLSYRPEFEPKFPAHCQVTHIGLNRLRRAQVIEMIGTIPESDRLSAPMIEDIVAKTDGVPLFVEELTKSVIELSYLTHSANNLQSIREVPEFTIPETLEDSLKARLDSLSPVKTVIDLCATLGREFSYDLLKAVSPMDDQEIKQGLARLVKAEILYQRGLSPNSTYIFKHALIQEVAYQSLLKSKRQQLHQKIAAILVQQFPEIAEIQPELIAHHYTEAKNYEPAIEFWQTAGERALQRSANVETVRHLTKGLDLIEKLPLSQDRDARELAIRTSLGTALIATKGYQAPEVERIFARAKEICLQLNDGPQLFAVLYGLWFFYLMKAEPDKSVDTAREILRLAEQGLESRLLVDANNIAGVTAFFHGDHLQAQAYFDESLLHYDSEKHQVFVYKYGRDAGVMSRLYGGWNLWYLGYPDRALERTTEAIKLAKKNGHPHTVVGALLVGALSHVVRREVKPTLAFADEGAKMAKEYGFSMWLQHATTAHAAGLLLVGDIEAAIVKFREVEAIREATGIKLLCPNAAAALGDAYLQAGRPSEALREIEYGLEFVRVKLDRYHEPELYRLKGEIQLSLHPNDPVLAESSFNQAIKVAKAHRARSFELRAATSLGRLWQSQGKAEEARVLISTIYEEFTEGFETADLKDAKTLLGQLS